MSVQRKLLLVVAVVVAAAAALAAGVSANTLLLVGVALLCPAAMYFGMSGHGGCGHAARCDHAGGREGAREAAAGEGRKAA
jgi:hypothetical protein